MAACMAMLALSLAMAGCKMFGKKPAGGSSNPAPNASAAADNRGRLDDRAAVPVGVNGLLAGQIIDGLNRKPPPTTIQVVATQDGKETGGAPITVKLDPVTADNQGYFTIQNLQPGRTYQLIARAEDGSRKLAGVTWATPPNPRVTIRMSEDFAGKEIPEGAPPRRNQRSPQNEQRTPQPEDKGKSPAASIERPIVPKASLGGEGGRSATSGAELGTPMPRVPSHETPAGTSVPNIENITGGDELTRRDPKVYIPGPGRDGNDPSATSPNDCAIRATVPSCSLSGRQLHNFALNDIDGKPWEFRKDRKGRLVLIDFWGTWCIPCQQAIPHLKDLQWRYGQWGLEVIGIAYESGTSAEQARNVRRVAARLQTNYRMLLGTGRDADCPVRRQFEVRQYPSLFLLDERGTILWQSREGLGPRELQELEFEIKRRLNVR
jgi:thiol-disulfide isomerase/thioredoxin